MAQKGIMNQILNSGEELLKKGEQSIENVLGTDIDIFTDKHKGDIEKTTEKTKEKLTTLQGSVVLDKIKKQLKEGFIEFKSRINGLSDIILSNEDKSRYIKEAQNEYNGIKKILDTYSNDGDLKEGYDTVNDKISQWLKRLETGSSNDIVNKAKISLKNLQIEMQALHSKTPEYIEAEKAKVQKKYKNKGNKEEEGKIKTFLTKIGIPAGMAGIVVLFLNKLGFIGGDYSGEKGFFGKIFDFVKNPFEGLLGFIGLGKDKKNEIKETEGNQSEITIKAGEIKDSSDIVTYTNEKVEISLYEGSVKSIKVDNINYKFNLEILGAVSFIRNNNKDYLKIGDKEIDLFKLILISRKKSDIYEIYENFQENNDLKLVKAS